MIGDDVSLRERERRLGERGYPIEIHSTPGATYVPVRVVGSVAWTAGMVPFLEGNDMILPGKVGLDLGIDEAQSAAALCAANMLRAIYHEFGGLDVIAKVIKITGYVHSETGFTDQHLVINGASELLIHVLGEDGQHARSAVGVAELPLNASVEVEGIFAIR